MRCSRAGSAVVHCCPGRRNAAIRCSRASMIDSRRAPAPALSLQRSAGAASSPIRPVSSAGQCRSRHAWPTSRPTIDWIASWVLEGLWRSRARSGSTQAAARLRSFARRLGFRYFAGHIHYGCGYIHNGCGRPRGVSPGEVTVGDRWLWHAVFCGVRWGPERLPLSTKLRESSEPQPARVSPAVAQWDVTVGVSPGPPGPACTGDPLGTTSAPAARTSRPRSRSARPPRGARRTPPASPSARPGGGAGSGADTA
jgi:hypothetical protein